MIHDGGNVMKKWTALITLHNGKDLELKLHAETLDEAMAAMKSECSKWIHQPQSVRVMEDMEPPR